MATYTTNFNLEKPDSSDAFGDFRASYNGNMDIIDANLGSGGGHTIVDENGSNMPAESKLQFTGGVTVTDDNVNGVTVVDITGGGGGSSVFLNTIYTDTEKRIGYWRDKKPLYQITYIFNTPQTVNASPAWFDTGITRNDIEHIVKTDGFRADTNYVLLNGGLNGSNNIVVMQTRPTAITDFKGFTIQYTKTTDTPEPNPQFGNVIYLPTIYSDEERQVGVWRDNKPLYQKTINFGALPNADQKAVNHNISDLDQLVSVNAVAIGATNNFSLSYIDTNSLANGIGIYVSNTAITIRCGSNRSSYNAYVTLQYTKTTDTAGSGNWNTDGIPTHHYSTNEQVIGTWIDGKPLYEKTINYGTLPNVANVAKDVNHNIANVDKIWITEGFATNGTFVNQLNLSGVNNGEWYFGATSTYIRCVTQSDRSAYSAYVTIRYTKTTD